MFDLLTLKRTLRQQYIFSERRERLKKKKQSNFFRMVIFLSDKTAGVLYWSLRNLILWMKKYSRYIEDIT